MGRRRPATAREAPDRGCPVAGSGCPGSHCFGFSRAVRGPGDPVYSGFELVMLVYSRVIPKPLKLRPNDF